MNKLRNIIEAFFATESIFCHLVYFFCHRVFFETLVYYGKFWKVRKSLSLLLATGLIIYRSN